MLAALIRRDVSLLRDGIERVADVSEAVSAERLERALARLMAENVRADRHGRPTVLQDLVAHAGAVRHPPARRPRRPLARARDARRHAPRDRAGCSLVGRGHARSMTRRRLARIDRDDDDPRRARGRAAAPAPPARSHRPHPHAHQPGRAAHPQRRRRGRPAHPAHARQPRAARRRSARCSWSSATLMLVAAGQGPDRRRRHRAVRDPRLRRPARRHRAPAPRRRGRRSGRDDMEHDVSHRPTPFDRRRPSRRAPTRGRRASATSAIPATSCGWCCGAARPCSLAIVIELGDAHRATGLTRRPRPRRGARARRRSASCCSRCAQVGRDRRAGRRRGRARSCDRNGGGGSASSCSPAPPARRCSVAARHWRSTSRARVPDAVTSGTWVASTRSRRSAYLAGAAAVATVGKPWLGRVVAARAPTSRSSALALVMAVAGSAGVPALLLARRDRRCWPAPRCWSSSARPNRRPAPAIGRGRR